MNACKIPEDFKPRILVKKSYAGTPQPALQPEHYADFERKITDSSEKPEECEILFDSLDTKISIVFTIIAVEEDKFRIESIEPFQPMKETIQFNVLDFQQMSENPETEFETGDKIHYSIKKDGMDFQVSLIF